MPSGVIIRSIPNEHRASEWESFTEPHFRTGGPAGELLNAIAARIAEQERIRRRTSGTKSGHAIGRPQRVFNRDHSRQLRSAGWSFRKIGRSFEVNEATIRRTVRQKAEST